MKSINTVGLSFIIFLFSLLCQGEVWSARLYPEKLYQTAWCSANNGNAEVPLYDKSRVDCILPEYAIEFDFANKWSEAVGQSLYYGYMTRKKPGIVLIMEQEQKDKAYLNRLNKIATLYGITVWIMRPSDLENPHYPNNFNNINKKADSR